MNRFASFALPAALAALLLCPRSAAAHDDPGGSGNRPATPSGEAEAPSEEGEKEEAEPRWEVIVDVAAGGTTTDILTGGRPAAASAPPANVFDSTRVTATSILFGV